MGRLTRPILMSMALSPFAGAVAFRLGGANLLLALLTIIAALNIALCALLGVLSRTTSLNDLRKLSE